MKDGWIGEVPGLVKTSHLGLLPLPPGPHAVSCQVCGGSPPGTVRGLESVWWQQREREVLRWRTSFKKGLWRSYSVPGTVVGMRDMMKNRTKPPSSWSLYSNGDIVSKQVDQRRVLYSVV